MLDEQVQYTAPVSGGEDLDDKKSDLRRKPTLGALTDVPALRDYFNRVGAVPRSLRTAVISEQAGKYRRDLATIRVEKDGQVKAPVDYEPTEEEAAAIKVECAGFRWPELRPLAALGKVPEMVSRADPKDVFEFRNTANEIVMVQVRTVSEAGVRAYVPWTYWDDGEWRPCEPDGPLPLYNAHRLKDASTVFIHEGAKAARHMQRLSDGRTREDEDERKSHPWGAEMTGAVHVGWIGGAPSPHRTDWTVLKKAGVTRAFIVADNDEVGRKAVPKIAEALHCPTFMIQFGDQFPLSFDLGDKFPEGMFKGGRYVGPAFYECQHPATWATDQISNPEGKGRPITILRESFRSMWAYAEENDLFVCREMPEILRPEAVLNKMLMPFSHVSDTTRLILKAASRRDVSLCYRPDVEGLSINANGSSAINLHRPSLIKAATGDPKPFLDFLAYLIPNAGERHEVERWCATLIARPGIRMKYSLLLISETQGTGKSTLGSAILGPLVGETNWSCPGENDIKSQFNDWVANKRLTVVNEIYQGSSWKVYNSLKPIVTDKFIMVNQKYARAYRIDNWCHIFACSNSKGALKIENQDRRWLIPEVTEDKWDKPRFKAFYAWLDAGGLSIIRAWAEAFGDYVDAADEAPPTERKKEMAAASRSAAQVEAAALAEALQSLKRPAAVGLKAAIAHIKAAVNERVYDQGHELERAMTEQGVKRWPKRLRIAGRLQHVVVNAALLEELGKCPSEESQGALIQEKKLKPEEVYDREM